MCAPDWVVRGHCGRTDEREGDAGVRVGRVRGVAELRYGVPLRDECAQDPDRARRRRYRAAVEGLRGEGI